ncbi:GntR family transcriptional regulator [Streptomyces sp. NPDC045456]|uniref:GntR family transcriptional regulator n=1 Tax=Streptomyces sp. NPDC045456 TaxID=3155254 RepID=UPI0033CA8EE9
MPKIERAVPPYMQVVTHIRGQITSGELSPGDLIPPDRALAEEWGVSRATAQKAVTVLKAEGLVEATQGSGTRVRRAPALHHNGYDRAATVRRTGKIYAEGEYARITSASLQPAPADVADALGIAEGAPAIRRIRVTYGPGDVALSMSTSWLDGALAASAPALLETERIREGTWHYLENCVGRTAVHGQDRISVRLATAEEAELLSVTQPAPVKVTRTTLRDEDGVTLEYGVSVTEGRESIYDYAV